MKELSSYYSSGTLNRTAHVYVDASGTFWVGRYQDDIFIELSSMHNHNESYAEDAAENWVEGYGNFAIGADTTITPDSATIDVADDQWHNHIIEDDI